MRQLAEQRRSNEAPPSPDGDFICKCGQVIADPFSAKALELHGPHFVAASLDRTHEYLTRWHDHARRRMDD